MYIYCIHLFMSLFIIPSQSVFGKSFAKPFAKAFRKNSIKGFAKWVCLAGLLAHLHIAKWDLGIPSHKYMTPWPVNHTTVHHTWRDICDGTQITILLPRCQRTTLIWKKTRITVKPWHVILINFWNKYHACRMEEGKRLNFISKIPLTCYILTRTRRSIIHLKSLCNVSEVVNFTNPLWLLWTIWILKSNFKTLKQSKLLQCRT